MFGQARTYAVAFIKDERFNWYDMAKIFIC